MLGSTRALRAWFVSAGLSLLAGCGSLLGLDDRSLDESELGAGYAGCVPGGHCDGCINEHHYDACRGDSSGGAGGTSGGNGGSSTDSGGSSNGGSGGGTSSVSTDVGGASGASNAGGAAGSAGFGGAAGGSSSSSGGAGGAPVVCGGDAPVDSCDSCVCDTCSSQLEACAGDVGCIEIWTCFDEHACDPTPSVPNSCFAPENCQSAIMNNGGPDGEPIALVQAMLGCAIEECDCGNENCNLENSCDCSTCQAACECAGYPAEYCAGTCSNGPVQCGSAGPGACLGCSTCIGQCVCGGTSELDCTIACGLSTCDGDCNYCDNTVDSCVCGAGSTTSSCSEEQLGSSCYDYYALRVPAERLDCSVCGCENCPALNTRCEYDPTTSVGGVPGCVALLECLESTGCAGDECNEAATCGSLLDELGGPQSYSMEIAQGLLACKYSHGCTGCADPGGNMGIDCGDQTCYSYEPSGSGAGEATAPACCAGQSSNLCGYELGDFFPSPQGQCFPANAPGEANGACPGAQVTTDTYSAYLSGCCMTMNATCGLLENQIGLGCVPYDVVGQPNLNPAPYCSP